MKRPYSTFRTEEMILRDFLAADRTVLANERTLLAYVRTALASAVSGVSLLHFLEGPFVDGVGVLLILSALAIVLVGTRRYFQVHKRISAVGEPPVDEAVRARLRANRDEHI